MNLARIASRLSRRVCDRAAGRLRADGGFVLLESIIAISLITVIMAAVGAEYLTGLSTTSHQRAETTAIQLADTAMEAMRALHPSDLLKGRDRASVTTEYNALVAVPAAASWLSTDATKLAYDKSVTSGGSNAAIPTTATTQKPGAVSYQVYDYVECTLAATNGACKSNPTSNPPAVNYVHAVVAVLWTQRGCPNQTCSYITSTLINADPDPTFDLNQPLPPAPAIQSVNAQTVAVNDVYSLQLLVQNGKGVPPFTWVLKSGTLPQGLGISPGGLISGTVQGAPGSASSVIEVTDAFIRKTTVTINWTIKPPLTWVPLAGGTDLTPVPDQTGLVGKSTSLQVSATGGTGSPYAYSDPGHTLPPGLTLNASTGLISGTPTVPAPHKYAVQLTVKDNSGTRFATTSFTWEIDYPPLGLTSPADQNSTINTSVSLPLGATGGDGQYTWSATGLPSGLAIDPATGRITGTPDKLASPAPVTVTVRDDSAQIAPLSVTFNWAVLDKPAVQNPGDQKNSKGATVNLAITGSCPNTPCTYALNGNQPNNVKIDPNTGLISGTIATNAVGSASVVVTVTDHAGATASTTFAWTVYNAPTLSGLASHSDSEGAVDNVAIGYTCPYGPCTVAVSGAVPGIGLESTASKAGNNSGDTSISVATGSGSVYLTGTVQSTAVTGSATSKTYSLSLAITSVDKVTPTASTATWKAYPAAPTISGASNLTKAAGSAASQTLTYTCQVGSCTVSVSGAPSGIGVATSTTATPSASISGLAATTSGTLYLRGTISSGATKKDYNVTVTITDGNALSGTATATWTVQ